MNIETQISLFLGLIGAFNSLILSLYLVFFVKFRKGANYYLSALLLAIGIKIIISVFFYFDRNLSQIVVNTGFLANALIGPFFYLYVRASISDSKYARNSWWLHIIPWVVSILLVGYFFPSIFSHAEEVIRISQFAVAFIYVQWLVYLIIIAFLLRPASKRLFRKDLPSSQEDVWLISIFVGISLIWLGPLVTAHTTYMVGAFSFSFVFYALLLFWIFKLSKKSSFLKPQTKYFKKKIEAKEANEIHQRLKQIITEKELFRNPDLKLVDLSNEIEILPHRLSQFLNDNLGKSFSLFINEYRIEAAKRKMLNDDKFTLETIGYDCGFNSKSTFFSTFKKLTGLTPSNYRKQDFGLQ